MSRSNMQGSVASFVVVGVVLAVLLLGGIYVVKNQLADNLQAGDAEVAVEISKDAESDNQATEIKDQSTDSDEANSEAEKSQDDVDTDASTEAAYEDEDEDETMPVTGVSVDELPKTGPAETLGALVSLGLLSGAFIYYRHSVSAKA